MYPLSSRVGPYDTKVSKQVANDSGANYDAILDLFDCIESSLKFLRIFIEIPSHLIVIQKAMKILFQLILVLAFATKQAKRGRTREFVLADVTPGSAPCRES